MIFTKLSASVKINSSGSRPPIWTNNSTASKHALAMKDVEMVKRDPKKDAELAKKDAKINEIRAKEDAEMDEIKAQMAEMAKIINKTFGSPTTTGTYFQLIVYALLFIFGESPLDCINCNF